MMKQSPYNANHRYVLGKFFEPLSFLIEPVTVSEITESYLRRNQIQVRTRARPAN